MKGTTFSQVVIQPRTFCSKCLVLFKNRLFKFNRKTTSCRSVSCLQQNVRSLQIAVFSSVLLDLYCSKFHLWRRITQHRRDISTGKMYSVKVDTSGNGFDISAQIFLDSSAQRHTSDHPPNDTILFRSSHIQAIKCYGKCTRKAVDIEQNLSYTPSDILLPC